MTIIHGVEIDNIQFIPNDIKALIREKEPIEDKLHVVISVSNPAQFARRYILAREFIKRIEEEETDVILYIVELAYPGQGFHVTDTHNHRHLRLRTDVPLWAKENMMNIAANKLLPPTWKAVAFIDADIEFMSPHWAKDCLKILAGRDVVQLFSHAIDMDRSKDALNIFPSLACRICHGKPLIRDCKPVNFPHPGFAWAMTRRAFEQLGGLYEYSILGSGDMNLATALLGNGLVSLNDKTTDGYKRSLQEYTDRAKGLTLGYVPVVIRHHYHGAKRARGYQSRWKILVTHGYDPFLHVTKNDNDLLVPTPQCPREMLDEIKTYFFSRNEDD